ncbi:hypothetical protein WH47_11935 [Habropoda laboriosa]|uniref:Uncharacterized protein n=1 Tax=Habropoda laboriosa TaxID=597456 RepID=A0A0L7R7Z5_9HYME|nr:hypothetical protein WH47_11935 [Habropoda laboriosa]
MVLISEALSSQNYDELEGRVNEEAIKVLKDKVESLSSYQRKLIALDADKTICFPGDIVVKEEGHYYYNT